MAETGTEQLPPIASVCISIIHFRNFLKSFSHAFHAPDHATVHNADSLFSSDIDSPKMQTMTNYIILHVCLLL